VIEWRRNRLRARLQPAFPPGIQVTWAISPGQLVLLGQGRVPQAGKDNVVDGVITQLVRLGNNAALAVSVGGADRPPLFMSIPLHVAEEHSLAVGARVTVSLLIEGIHLMPADGRAELETSAIRRMQPASDLIE
jgi:molybdate transport system ATP-binding protein